MSASIFISFAAQDRKVATTLCAALESRGFPCWISARDILPGENFQVAIVRAIRRAKMMLLVFTANSNNSEEMTKELALASQQKLIVVPLRVEDVQPNEAFSYEFATRQWIDFFADWEAAINQLVERIETAIPAEAAPPKPAPPKPAAPKLPPKPAARKPEPAAVEVVESPPPAAALHADSEEDEPEPLELASAPAEEAEAEPEVAPAPVFNPAAEPHVPAFAALDDPAAESGPYEDPAPKPRSRVGLFAAAAVLVLVVVGLGLAVPALMGKKSEAGSAQPAVAAAQPSGPETTGLAAAASPANVAAASAVSDGGAPAAAAASATVGALATGAAGADAAGPVDPNTPPTPKPPVRPRKPKPAAPHHTVSSDVPY